MLALFTERDLNTRVTRSLDGCRLIALLRCYPIDCAPRMRFQNLVYLLGQLWDPATGRVTVPNFYDSVQTPDAAEVSGCPGMLSCSSFPPFPDKAFKAMPWIYFFSLAHFTATACQDSS